MPHCIIEYSQSIGEQKEEITDAVHNTVLTCGLFSPEKIRTRATAYECYRLGAHKSNFIHVTIRLFAGRSSQEKTTLSEQVVQALSAIGITDTLFSCECVDIHQPSSCQKASNN